MISYINKKGLFGSRKSITPYSSLKYHYSPSPHHSFLITQNIPKITYPYLAP